MSKSRPGDTCLFRLHLPVSWPEAVAAMIFVSAIYVYVVAELMVKARDGHDHRFGHFVIPAKAGIQKEEHRFPLSREMTFMWWPNL
jgi:hypothetical protein